MMLPGNAHRHLIASAMLFSNPECLPVKKIIGRQLSPSIHPEGQTPRPSLVVTN